MNFNLLRNAIDYNRVDQSESACLQESPCELSASKTTKRHYTISYYTENDPLAFEFTPPPSHIETVDIVYNDRGYSIKKIKVLTDNVMHNPINSDRGASSIDLSDYLNNLQLMLEYQNSHGILLYVVIPLSIVHRDSSNANKPDPGENEIGTFIQTGIDKYYDKRHESRPVDSFDLGDVYRFLSSGTNRKFYKAQKTGSNFELLYFSDHKIHVVLPDTLYDKLINGADDQDGVNGALMSYQVTDGADTRWFSGKFKNDSSTSVDLSSLKHRKLKCRPIAIHDRCHIQLNNPESARCDSDGNLSEIGKSFDANVNNYDDYLWRIILCMSGIFIVCTVMFKQYKVLEKKIQTFKSP